MKATVFYSLTWDGEKKKKEISGRICISVEMTVNSFNKNNLHNENQHPSPYGYSKNSIPTHMDRTSLRKTIQKDPQTLSLP